MTLRKGLRALVIAVMLAMAVLAAGRLLAEAPTTGVGASAEPQMSAPTAEERAEADGRKACKIAICSAFKSRRLNGDDVSCNVVKSWRKEQLSEMLATFRAPWPYGGVRCASAVKLKRADIVKAASERQVEIRIDRHSVFCVLASENIPPTTVRVDVSPWARFKSGKATKAKANWSRIDAPLLMKGALWTATTADNLVNAFSSSLVADINDFLGGACDELNSESAANDH